MIGGMAIALTLCYYKKKTKKLDAQTILNLARDQLGY
jgi:hypothetical protein